MKTSRMFSILNLLVSNDKMTADELAERLDVSKRTIYRDIEALNASGVPVVSLPGKGGGVSIVGNYKIEQNFLSEEEMQSISISLNALRTISSENIIPTLMGKILPEHDSDIYDSTDTMIDFSSGFTDNNFKLYMDTFRQSIKKHTLIEIEYQSNNGAYKRTIEPYKLVFKYSDWYLYAYCLTRNEFRLFKINRIITINVLDTTFEAREYKVEDIPTTFKNNYLADKEILPVSRIILQYKKEDETFLIDQIGVQKFHFDTTNHTISFETSDMAWANNFIFNLKDKVKVIQPTSIITNIEHIIENMSILYKS